MFRILGNLPCSLSSLIYHLKLIQIDVVGIKTHILCHDRFQIEGNIAVSLFCAPSHPMVALGNAYRFRIITYAQDVAVSIFNCGKKLGLNPLAIKKSLGRGCTPITARVEISL